LHVIGVLFPHINDDAPSKSHEIYSEDVQIIMEILKRVKMLCLCSVLLGGLLYS